MWLERFRKCEGDWSGENLLHDPMTQSEQRSPSRLVVVPMLGGRFVRMDYDWVYDGKPQEGSLFLGHGPSKGTSVSAHWVDTWHMSDKVMTLAGTASDEQVTLVGSYAVPGHPDWGWRIEVEVPAEGGLLVRMFNVPPGDTLGQSAVEASYRRVA